MKFSIQMRILQKILILVALCSFPSFVVHALDSVKCWAPYTQTVTETGGDWRTEPITVTFENEQSEAITIDTYWDGGNTWKFRFSPTQTGQWTWKASNGEEGQFDCVAPTPAEIKQNANYRGQIRVRTKGDGAHRFFEYADGTPFLGLAEQFWDFNNSRWIHVDKPSQESSEVDRYLQNRKERGFNIVQIRYLNRYHSSFQAYNWGQNEGGFAFPNNPGFEIKDGKKEYLRGGNGDFRQMNPAYFQALDRRFVKCWKHGFVVAGHPLWVSDTKISNEEMEDLTRYLIARYGAYNIMWSLSGEFDKAFREDHCDWFTKGVWADENCDEFTEQSDLRPWRALGKAAARFLDYGEPISVHPNVNAVDGNRSSKDYFAEDGWLGHDWIQTYKAVQLVPQRVYRDYSRQKIRPVFFSEGIREGDQTEDWGDHRLGEYGVRWEAWQAYLSGAAIHTYRHYLVYMDKNRNNDQEKAVKNLLSPGAKQMKHVTALLREVDFWKLEPALKDLRVDGDPLSRPESNDFGNKKALDDFVNMARAKDRSVYITYIPENNAEKTIEIINMDDQISYHAHWFNPREGESQPIALNVSSTNGTYSLPNRPSNEEKDWVFVLNANEESGLQSFADKYSSKNIVYPQGANTVDVTQAPFHAKGDGVTDDTEALIAAVTFAKENNRICYFPKGTYLVHDTILYQDKVDSGQGAERNGFIRYHGQHREKTIIRLKDRLAAYNPGKSKAVLATIHKGRWSNIGFNNEVCNLTIDTGNGNPGAVGLAFNGSNTARVSNVTIRSEDSQGAIGLHLIKHGPALVTHIWVEGFDIGVQADSDESNWVLEHIDLIKQNKIGLLNDRSPTSVRQLRSVNSVPAVRNRGEGLLVLLDSELTGGAATEAAIMNQQSSDDKDSYLFVRNISTSGYEASILDRGNRNTASDIDEYVSHGVQSLFGEKQNSLHLPIEETPEVRWDPPEEWVCIDDFGAQGDDEVDDTQAIQKAMDSGATTVYAQTEKKYLISDTITVGGKVRRANFMWARFKITGKLDQVDKPLFKIVDGDSSTVVIEKAHVHHRDGYKNNFPFVGQATTRTVVMRDLHIHRGRGYLSMKPGGKVFIENVKGKPRNALGDPYAFEFRGVQAWARQLNPDGGHHVLNDSGLLWVFGFKTENSPTKFTTIHDGLTEVLGGIVWTGSRNEDPSELEPAIVNRDSHVSAIWYEAALHSDEVRPIQVVVQETRQDRTRELLRESTPKRSHRKGLVLPLYAGYDRSIVNQQLKTIDSQ